MKPSHLLLQFLAVLAAAESKDLDMETRGLALETRSDLTYWQNWCIAGGAVLGGLGTLAGGIASIISASSSDSSCTQVNEIVEDKRSESSSDSADWHLNVTGVTENLQAAGFNITHSGWTCVDEENNNYQYYDTVQNEELVLRNFTIDGTSFGGFMSNTNTADNTTDTTALEKRVSWEKYEVYVMYHASGTCKTEAGKAKIKKAVKKAITHQSTYKREAACYTLYNNGGWIGHLKVLEVYSDSTVPSTGYQKTCAGAKGVSNTCS